MEGPKSRRVDEKINIARTRVGARGSKGSFIHLIIVAVESNTCPNDVIINGHRAARTIDTRARRL